MLLARHVPAKRKHPLPTKIEGISSFSPCSPTTGTSAPVMSRRRRWSSDAAFAVVSLHSFSYHHGVLATTIWQAGLPPSATRNGALKRFPSFGRRCFDPSE